MRYFEFSIALLFLSMLSLTSEAAPHYLDKYCSNTTTFTRNSIYHANLNHLLSTLSSNANSNSGFNTTAGQVPDMVYGLFLCRGDVPTEICQDCVTSATKYIVQLCPTDKLGTIWYDECLLRYSNEYFSIMGGASYITMWINSTQNTTEQQRFNELVKDTLIDIATQAANAPSGAKRFATKEAKFSRLQTLYSLVQCTPDLPSEYCNTCLQGAIAILPIFSTGNEGGRILHPSCFLRYEVYLFYYQSNQTIVGEAPVSTHALPTPALPPPEKRRISSRTIAFITVPTVGIAVVLSTLCYCFLRWKTRKKYNVVKNEKVGSGIVTIQSLQYDISTIEAATNNFSDDNMIGAGGFGNVYKGTLSNGQEIAVKKLSTSSRQGTGEFKNEVVLVAKLQHRNLARLLGFCLEGTEKILIYEFVPNKSLDYFLFDLEKQIQLDWSRRYKIIMGTARGLLYLHEESRLKIIHRDLKASNILLDGDMNPKISDFGTARIIGVNQSQGTTSRIVGTFGYMSPEYAIHGQFSAKSDVFSFGVIALEIICGTKNGSFCQSENAENLPSFAWRHWRDGTPLELIHPTIRDSNLRNAVTRCIQIGLLCVQENPADRPTMATVVLMLDTSSVELPSPQQPAFFFGSRIKSNMPMMELESNQSTRKSMPSSVNEASLTHLYGR